MKFIENNYNQAYNLKNNKEFLNWLNSKIKNGYDNFIDIDQIQELIDKITYWYEIKYPDNRKKWIYRINYFEDVNKLSKKMSVRQFLNRITEEQLQLLTCPYRAENYRMNYIIDEKNNEVDAKTIIRLGVKEKPNKKLKRNYTNKFLVSIDAMSGQVDVDDNLKKYVDYDIDIDELYFLFLQKYNNSLEFSQLEDCVYNHNCDVELRKEVLKLVALKLWYSAADLEWGFLRLTKFVDEFNKELNINITPDDILEKDNNEKSKCKTLKK